MADMGDSARAGEAQVAQERAFHQRGEAQRAALLEQTEEEKKTAQQARLASIREQQASLAAQPLVRWLPTVPAEARVKPAEAATGAEKAASAEAVMGKPARPPDRLNERFTVTSAVLVQEPGRPERPGEPRESAELKELQGMQRAREGGTAAKADTVRVRREAERLAEDTKMDPSNCLMEILTFKEKVSFRGPCVGRSITSKADAQAAKCGEVTANVQAVAYAKVVTLAAGLSRKRNTNRLVGNR